MDIIIKTETKIIKIVSSVVAKMNSYRQLNKRDCEAGGILIGRENIETGNLIIEYITEPYKKDKRTRILFYRKDKKHIEFYNKLYKAHNGIYAYIGEWHTHPQDCPKYSWIDLKNWERISKMNEDKERTYYHVIVGNKEITVWEYNLRNKKAKRIY